MIKAADRREQACRRALRRGHVDLAPARVDVHTAVWIGRARTKIGTSFAAFFVMAPTALLLASVRG